MAVVYKYADSDGRTIMQQAHEEQGNTAVDYTGKQASSNADEDPLNVSDTGVETGSRISIRDYATMTSGVVYGLVENTVEGIMQMGAAVGKESQELKNFDNLEYAGIDEHGLGSESPGLSIPSMEEVGTALKGHIEATNQALRKAKDQGDYFGAGKAISDDPMLQMTGLGEMAIVGSLAKMWIITKLDSLAKNEGKISGTNGDARSLVDGKLGRPESAGQISDVGVDNRVKVRGEINAPDNNWSHLNLSERHFPGRASIPKKSGNTMLTATPQEAAADLAEIRRLGDEIRTGETFTVSSGRVYGVHNDSIHPVRGPGTVDITSSEYNILVTARKKSFENAQMSLDKMTEKGIFSQEQYDRTKALLELMNKKGG